ncbi:HAD family hydrolase [Streptomyces lunaelactis]|uniref:HAD family hydrolase n=1 Tax=Streptomyces lunaelactis TaxID=1535768 RepID=UPI0028166073|nr:HAD-IA family hydrolase [Streptomyces lunaelactis]
MTDSDAAEPQALLAAATCVLFDFDGPMCGLFHGHPAAGVAAELRAWAARAVPRVPADLMATWRSVDDPHAILSEAARRLPGSDLVGELEELLTSQESTATETAAATQGADQLIRRLSAAGIRLAVTTNNSASAVSLYLARVGLTEFFGKHVHGRMRDPRLLKPNPHCLIRALETTGSTATESLMIGDSVADYGAAAQLGVPFLGYARSPRKRDLLSKAGAKAIVASMSELVPVLDGAEPGLRVE